MPEMGDSRYAPTASPLWNRVAEALGAHDIEFADKLAYSEAMDTIPEDQLDDLTWEKLPQEVRDIIERCESRPRTSWDDPLDVPDDTSYMD